MFSKFAQNQTLISFAATLAAARQSLSTAQHAYSEAVSEIVHARAEVRWADYAADKAVRSTLRKAEDADGHKNGKIVSTVFPGGMTPIIKSVGSTQIKAMQDLENRLEAIAGHWDAALDERATLTKLRKEYEAALEQRRDAGQKASNKKALRDAAKEDFLDVYAQIAARVMAEFPRNRRMQDLFFDTVVEEGSTEAGSDEEDTAEGHADTAEGAPEPS